MPRYRRRYVRYRRPKAQYSINRKLNSSGNFVQHSSESTIYIATQRLVTITSDSGNDAVLDSPATIRHITVDIQTIPTIQDVSSASRQKEIIFPAAGWICVFVPSGTNPREPFSGAGDNIYNATLYEPQNYVLGSGTISQGAQTVVPIAGVSQSTYGVPGNYAKRIRVPLAKKLNPGDSIYMIYYLYNVPIQTGDVRDITPMETIVSYAVKH